MQTSYTNRRGAVPSNIKRTLKLYSPHPKQLEFHNSKARYRIAALGRQAGKSTMCLNELMRCAWEKPNTRYWFVSPTYDQAKTQYRRCAGMLSSCWQVLRKKNQTELRLKLINESDIAFKSGEVFENLRGDTLNGVVIDEVRQQKTGLWTTVIRPMLTTTKGWAAFVSTPNGFDDFYDLFETAKYDTSDTWWHMQAPSTANPLFTEEEYATAKREMSEAEFDQEINAQFRDLQAGSAYVNFSKDNLSTTCPFLEGGKLYSPYLPVGLAMDFNLSPMAWTLMQQRVGDFYAFDSIFLKRSHTQEAAKELVGRLKRLDLRANPQVVLAGDATSKSGQRAAAGASDYIVVCQALDEAGITWSNSTPDSNPTVKDRVNTVNAKLRSADGKVHLWAHPENCKPLIKDFERVTWKQGSTSLILDQIKNRDLTHASDGVGYLVCALDPMRISGDIGKMLVIRHG